MRKQIGIGRGVGLSGLWAAALLLVTGGTATALQFTPPGTARIHNITSGQPGVPWNTGGLGVNGELAYSSTTQNMTMDLEVLALNYFDPANGSCPTDVGSNCNVSFGPNLTATLTADLVGATLTPLGGTFVQIDVRFQSTGGADLQVFDPTDLGAGSVLDASWQAGTFLGQPTTGLVATVVYDTFAGAAVGNVSATGFLGITGGAYASLFESGIGISVGSLFDFNGSSGSSGLDATLAYVIANGTLPDFTSEGQGQVYSVAAGQFVPEPATACLMGSLAAGWVLVRRRRS